MTLFSICFNLIMFWSNIHRNLRPNIMGLLKGYWRLLNYWRRGCWRWCGRKRWWRC